MPAPTMVHPRRVQPIARRFTRRPCSGSTAGAGHGDAREHVAHDVGLGHAVQLGVGSEDQSVLEHRRGQPADVVGNGVVASTARRECTRRALERERAARAHPEQQVGARACGLDEVDDVLGECRRDVDARDTGGGGGDVVGVGDRAQVVGRVAPGALRLEDRDLGSAVGVAQRDAPRDAGRRARPR